jgi:hypothetical protein
MVADLRTLGPRPAAPAATAHLLGVLDGTPVACAAVFTGARRDHQPRGRGRECRHRDRCTVSRYRFPPDE